MDNFEPIALAKEERRLSTHHIKWRISDFSRYYLATGGGDISQAKCC
ncbi:hypothetical protein KCP77_23885 [Salmonella enterica subsp. enterica]|nr:hypothetical protein KCP77_23885 [Salmonella enterica subsp. enterica]